MLNARFLPFAGALIALAFTASNVGSQGPSDKPIEQLLSQVPNGAAWQDLDQGLRAAFEMRASSVLAQDRQSWGLAGLQQKETLLLSAPTPAMTENIDLILSVTYASELPGGFKMARDVKNAELKRLLIRIYLAITDDRGFMLSNHPEFKGWDGMPVKELQLLDHQHYMEMGTWQRQTEEGLRKILDSELTSLEKGLRSKSYFTTRAGKYFDRPAVALNGSMGYSSLYAFPIDRRPFPSDEALLNAYNASMSTNFREVNMGTLDAFMFDYESEFNRNGSRTRECPKR